MDTTVGATSRSGATSIVGTSPERVSEQSRTRRRVSRPPEVRVYNSRTPQGRRLESGTLPRHSDRTTVSYVPIWHFLTHRESETRTKTKSTVSPHSDNEYRFVLDGPNREGVPGPRETHSDTGSLTSLETSPNSPNRLCLFSTDHGTRLTNIRGF